MQVECCSSHDGAGSQYWQSLAATLWLSVLVPLPVLGDRVALEGGITGVYQAADKDRVDAEATERGCEPMTTGQRRKAPT